MRAPKGVAGAVAHRGRPLPIPNDGVVDCPDECVETLAAHGFSPIDATAHAEADPLDRMSRVELFAFLKARGVRVGLPIRNDELRARARATLCDEGA
jgi:hypothetical protein